MTITPGIVTIGAPASLTFSAPINVSFAAQNVEQEFTTTGNMFWVNDMKGNDSGYNTTLQFSGNLTSTGGGQIAAANIQFKASSGIVVTMSGTTSTGVLMPVGITSYQSLDTARQWIYRGTGSNMGRIGRYGQNMWLNINVPANQVGGNYVGTVVYTLIEN